MSISDGMCFSCGKTDGEEYLLRHYIVENVSKDLKEETRVVDENNVLLYMVYSGVYNFLLKRQNDIAFTMCKSCLLQMKLKARLIGLAFMLGAAGLTWYLVMNIPSFSTWLMILLGIVASAFGFTALLFMFKFKNDMILDRFIKEYRKENDHTLEKLDQLLFKSVDGSMDVVEFDMIFAQGNHLVAFEDDLFFESLLSEDFITEKKDGSIEVNNLAFSYTSDA